MICHYKLIATFYFSIFFIFMHMSRSTDVEANLRSEKEGLFPHSNSGVCISLYM